ncbi:MAG: hypothetical protein CMN32_07890 [Saprospirales bacterium]|nr:hypothetical protein [Saprospirales bacterium]
MKKALFPIALVFTALSLFAQKEDNVWLFGGINAPDSIDATTVFDFSGGGRRPYLLLMNSLAFTSAVPPFLTRMATCSSIPMG